MTGKVILVLITMALNIYLNPAVGTPIPGHVIKRMNRPDTLVKNDQQEVDYYMENFVRNDNFVYHENIKTVKLFREGDPLSPAIIRVNSDDRLELRFDDLDGDIKDYRYTVLHCDANWQFSDLYQNEYIQGFTNDVIRDYFFSFNTIQFYTNYHLVLPNDQLRFTLSGNYILKVYLSDESDVVFTLRFMVATGRISIDGRVKRASAVENRNFQQEIDFTLSTKNFTVTDPYKTLNVIILQNYRWDNAIFNLKPKMVVGETIDYNYDYENVFNAGNQFRNFDIKSHKYYSPRIKSIDYIDGQNHVFLWPDERRGYKVYNYEEDLNGNYLVSCEDAEDPSTECDYTFVHFFLPYPAPFTDGNLYILGALTYWQFTPEGMMQYNFERKGYENVMYLKEGYFNYNYAFLENNSTSGDFSRIEGDHYETENEYLILVYYRRPGNLYDEIIGIQTLNSLRDK